MHTESMLLECDLELDSCQSPKPIVSSLSCILNIFSTFLFLSLSLFLSAYLLSLLSFSTGFPKNQAHRLKFRLGANPCLIFFVLLLISVHQLLCRLTHFAGHFRPTQMDLIGPNFGLSFHQLNSLNALKMNAKIDKQTVLGLGLLRGQFSSISSKLKVK